MKREASSSGAKATTRVLAFCFLAVWLFIGSTELDYARDHDFLGLYTGAKLALDGRFAELHDPARQFQLQRQLAPSASELMPFIRPSFYALFLSPLALLPIGTAFWVWVLAQAAAAVACTLWAVRQLNRDLLLFTCMYAPMTLSITHGQDAPFMLAVLVGAFALARKGRPSAGAVLSLALAKFHLLALWPLLLVVQRRWRMLGWFALGSAALVGLSLGLSGLTGVRLYFELLTRKDIPHLSPGSSTKLNLTALLTNVQSYSAVNYGILAFLTVLIAVVAVRRAPLWRLYALAITGSLLITPHVYWYDATSLLLPLWCGMALSPRPATRVVLGTLSHAVTSFFFLLMPPLRAVLLIALFLVVATDPPCGDPPGDEDTLNRSSSPKVAALKPSGQDVARGRRM